MFVDEWLALACGMWERRREEGEKGFTRLPFLNRYGRWMRVGVDWVCQGVRFWV